MNSNAATGLSKDPLARLAERQTFTAPYEQPAQAAIRNAFNIFGPARTSVRNLLHGTWLHEPLHVILVEVPIGAWTCTVAFDALAACGVSSMDVPADATLVLGLAGAAGAAITGLNDWADVEGPPRRLGAVHAISNVLATGLFALSLYARAKAAKGGGRRKGSRTTARLLAFAGYAVVSASAHLGGIMIYEHAVGVQDKVPLR